ncbi:hypothetical protein CONPUDRAFT_161834 [Coniophora puteana RWD-64-598 SS2]|uniref:MYND-type domain-containing protein n=1 Tax=Coniophora puteana (strain RWD-64-598) TaxID=741705 RepID=A0A5M3N731_CONPW|nr:uncharacterized protein CONPUDRAFT_161834 [Coniophora puteana RWD-64-598 SS2]EIW87249.1 hypothetical protein CONPUDRAFT_161834 [Coniophora puteana RWD-64-598 SS2]
MASLPTNNIESARLMNERGSIWANVFFPVTDIRKNRQRWVRDWDKGIAKFYQGSPGNPYSGAVAVFCLQANQMQNVLCRKTLDSIDHQRLREFKEECQKLYNGVVSTLRISSNKPLFHEDQREWLSLVSLETRKDIICEGFEQAGCHSWTGHDARMLCPELDSNSLLKGHGKGLFDLYDQILELDGDGGLEKFKSVVVMSEWWRNAWANGTVLRATPEVNRFCYEFVTCLRAEYLIDFVINTIKVIANRCHGSNKGISADSFIADRVLWHLKPSAIQELQEEKYWNSRSALTCENCQRRPKDVGVKFKRCDRCKRTLNFDVRYCSSACQKADWPEHKAHCGVEKVSKNRKAYRPEYSYTVALQLQVKLQDLTSVNYILFSRRKYPVGYEVSYFDGDDDKSEVWWDSLATLLWDAEKPGLEIIAKCLVDAVDDDDVRSGITREDIIAQLAEEYEVDVGHMLEKLEAKLAMEDDVDRYKGMIIQPLHPDQDENAESDSDGLDVEESSSQYSSPAMQGPKSRQDRRCGYCYRTPDDLGDGTRFLACAACKKGLDLGFFYCSKGLIGVVIKSAAERWKIWAVVEIDEGMGAINHEDALWQSTYLIRD